MTVRRCLLAASVAAILLSAAPGRLAACAFHTALPEATVSEQVAAATVLIAARPAALDPFRFAPVAVLKGEPSGSGPAQLVDSASRTRLAANPDDAVLFARGADGTWTRLIDIDATTRPLVARLVERAAFWTTADGAAERRDTFAALLADHDPELRRLALRELDALPYDVLRGGTYPVAPAALLEGIASIDDMPYAPIRILLLGIAGGSEAQEAIMARLAAMAAQGTDVHLGAWLTAAIESGGAGGMAEVERILLRIDLTDAQLTAVIRAFSVQSGAGDPALRAALDDSLRRLAARHPAAAPLIAQAFGAAEDYSQAALIRDLIAVRIFTEREDLMAAAAYLAAARTDGGASLLTTRPGRLPRPESAAAGP